MQPLTMICVRRTVASLGDSRYGSSHGCHFDECAKITWQKLKSVTCSFFDSILRSCINIETWPNSIIRACCANITKLCDKHLVLWHNTNDQRLWQNKNASLPYVQGLVLLTLYTKGSESIRAVAFLAVGYSSECGCDEFKSVAVRI